MNKFAGKYRSKTFVPQNVPFSPVVLNSSPRETIHYPSIATPGGDACLPPSQKYTGDNILGIGTMHKSNSVPVFSSEQAVEIATMRRN